MTRNQNRLSTGKSEIDEKPGETEGAGSRRTGPHTKLAEARLFTSWKPLFFLRDEENERFVILTGAIEPAPPRSHGEIHPVLPPNVDSGAPFLGVGMLLSVEFLHAARMRIAFFTETFLPKMDGIVTTLCQTIHQLRHLGHEVLIFAPDGGIAEFEGFRVVGMTSRAFPLYPELRLALPRASMRKVLNEFRPDILHVADPALLGVAGLYYGGGNDGGALQLPLVVAYHTDLPKYLHYYRLGFLEPYVWKILRTRHNRATLTLCTSDAMVSQLREHGIAPVALWPGAVDAGLFRPCRRSDAMRRRLTQGHPDQPLLLYVGRLSAEKNLESLRPWLHAFPQARLALVGGGPHRKAIEKHFAGLPVFFAGFLYKEELASAYASSDVFVMPSRTETLGLVVLEAMASGLPVVAARAGGIPEMIQHEVTGYLVETESEAINWVGALLGSQDLRQTMGQNAQAEAASRSWKYATLQLISQYEEAIAMQRIGPGAGKVPSHPGWREPAKRALRRSILFAARKLLP